jgi:hypothetical protein
VAAVLNTPHDIYSSLETQLVPELKCWISHMEFVERHPSGLNCRLYSPTNKNLTATTGGTAFGHFRQLQAHASMEDWWKNTRAS